MKTIKHIIMVFTLCTAIGCNKYELQNIDPKQTSGQHKADALSTLADPRGNLNLQELEVIKVYFEYYKFNIQIKKAIDEPAIVAPPAKYHAGTLYVYDQPSMPIQNKKVFYAVSSIMTDPDQSMLLNTIAITFNPGFPDHQFYSDMQVVIASQGIHPAITLTPKSVVYVGRLFEVAKQPVNEKPHIEF